MLELSGAKNELTDLVNKGVNSTRPSWGNVHASTIEFSVIGE